MSQHYDNQIPPPDHDLQYSIEQMAAYVSQYGPEAEEKARSEHRNNPHYSFLFGGRYSDYYQHCLRMNWERGIPSQNVSQAQHLNPQQMEEVQQITTRLDQLKREIAESEMNLKAQEESIPMQKEVEFGKQVAAAEEQKIAGYLANVKLDVLPFFEMLSQLNNPKASKDNIASSKKWIVEHCLTDQQREVILTYLLSKVKDIQSNDCFRLNILYLINDWAHYCQKKKLDSITQMLSRYVPQMYAFTVEPSKDPVLQPKLEKLIGVWEGSKYFSDQCFKQLRNPTHIYVTAKNATLAEYASIMSKLEMQFQAMFSGYEQQHHNFVRHNGQQIAQLEGQFHQIHHGTQGNCQQTLPTQRRSRFDQQTRHDSGDFGRFFPQPPRTSAIDETWREPTPEPSNDGDDIDGHPYNEESLIPNNAYYNLPAAIMVPHIPFENMTYKPIDPKGLRLPPPIPPSQRLIDALEAFYIRPSSLDSQGWEENGLADFYDRKLRLKKIMEEKLTGEKKTFEDIITNRPNAEDIKLQAADRETLISRLKKEMKERDERRKSRSRSRSRDRSRSRSSSSSRSRSSSSSSASRKKRSKTRSSSPRRSRTRSRSSSPKRPFIRERSPSPAGFGRPSFSLPVQTVNSENKGAMLMAKMGWTGKGLGAKESGIVEPVSGGEVRDKVDMFRGLGSKADPYEQFRKMRSGNYHDKNQLAAEERERDRKTLY